MRVSVTRRFSFEAAHTLKGHGGKCNRLHGHSYKMEVAVSCNYEGAAGEEFFNEGMPMFLDFKDLDDMGRAWVHDLDHRYLNEFLKHDNPTAEYLAYWFARRFKKLFIGYGYGIKVTIWETEDSYVTLEM